MMKRSRTPPFELHALLDTDTSHRSGTQLVWDVPQQLCAMASSSNEVAHTMRSSAKLPENVGGVACA